MAVTVSTMPRRLDHALLFSGLSLTNKVHKTQYATQIVGDVFERLSHAVVGRGWIRLYPDSEADIRPDLGKADWEMDFVESKAAQHRWKVSVRQLAKYRELLDENRHANLNYFFWQYGQRATVKLVADGKTKGGLIKLLTDNVVSLTVVHWSIVEAMRHKIPKNVTIGEYDSWKDNCSDEPYCSMQFGEPFFRRLREAPAKTLINELDLDADAYECRTHYSSMCRKIEIEGVEFKTRRFAIHKYVPNENYKHVKEGVPF